MLAAVTAAAGVGALVCAAVAGEMRDNVITVVHPWVVYSLMIAGLSASVMLVGRLLRRGMGGRQGVGKALVAACSIVVFGGASFMAWFVQRTFWRCWDTVPDPREPRLVALTAGFVDHSTVMADETQGAFAGEFRVIATSPPEGPECAPFVMRPSGMAHAGGVVARNGYVAIVGSSSPPICYGVLRKADLERARATCEPATFDQSGDPFVLVGDGESVNDADVSALALKMRSNEPDFSGHLPNDAAIESAKRSPNPSVRAAAERLAGAMPR